MSIGMVAEDGRELYAQSCEFNLNKVSDWVMQNVIPYLDICPYIQRDKHSCRYDLDHHKQGQCLDQIYGLRHRCPWRSRGQLKEDILSFMDVDLHGKPELWGYYSAYDHVAFCQLFGTMMDLPKDFPMLTYDLRQWLDMKGLHDIRQPDDSIHQALEDARWIKQTWERFKGVNYGNN